MLTTFRLFGALLLIVLWGVIADTALSQRPGRPAAQGQESPATKKRATPRPIHVMGRVLAVAPDLLVVEAEDGRPWEFKIIDRTIVDVSGHTDARALGAGTPVRFHAYLDRRRTSRDELAELTIFSPGPDSRPTLQPRKDLPTAADQAGDGKKLKRKGDLANLLDRPEEPRDEPKAKKAGKEKRPPSSDDTFQYHYVAGRIRSVRKNFMTVLAGPSVTVRVRLAKRAVVNIQSDDYQMARRGDEVDVKGFYVYPGKANAHEVFIKVNLEEEDEGIPIREGRRPTVAGKPRRGQPRSANQQPVVDPLGKRPLERSVPDGQRGGSKRD